MRRRCERLAVFGGLAALLTLSVFTDHSEAQTTVRATPQDKQGQRTPRPYKMITALNESVDMKDFRQETTLKELLLSLHKHLEARGIEFNVIVQADLFREENPDAPDIFETRVRFPDIPKKMTVANMLNGALSKVATGNATFVVLPDRIEITTFEDASVERRLQKRLTASFENRKLSEVLRELSEKTGTTIVIDKRAAEKEDRLVSATFLNDINLAGALRVLSEMAELKVVVLDGAIYVTTPAYAETLRKEKLQMDEQLSPLWPILPPYPGSQRRDPAAAVLNAPGAMPRGVGLAGFPRASPRR
jgi:hypothetical protein